MPSAPTARDDRRLVHGDAGRDIEADDGVTGLVIGGQLLLLLRHGHGLALGAHHDLVLGVLELAMGDHALTAAGCQQRRLVDEVHQVRARETGRAAGEDLEIDIRRHRHLADMDAQDLLAAGDVRVRNDDLAVEAARTQQRGVEHVGTVGRGDDDDALVRLEAVHLHQELVQRLLALVIAAAEAGAAMAADRVDLVDEDDAGRVLLGLFEHIADAAGANADEHLDEVGARDREERHIGLACDGARSERLTGTGRADEQDAARDAPAQPLELLGIAQELDDLLQVLLGLVDARDILEGDAAMRFGQELGLGLAEAHRPAGTVLHLAGHEDPQADEDDEGQRVDQQRHEPRRAFRRSLGRDLHALLGHGLQQVRIAIGRIGHEAATIREGAGNLLAGDDDVRHASGLGLVDQLAIGDFIGAGPLARALEQSDERQDQQKDHHPEGEIAKIRIHSQSDRASRNAG